MREQVLNLLSTGASQEDVLKIVGCSADYIGELLKEPEFVQELASKRGGFRQELIEEGYAKLEQSAINAITKEIKTGMVDIPAMCRILETAAKNRILYRQPNNHYQNPTVHLSVELKMPQGAEHAGVTIDQKSGQILAIGDRDMTTMPVQGVQRLFKNLEQKAQAEARQQPSERSTIDQDLQDLEGDRSHEPENYAQTTEPVPSARAA